MSILRFRGALAALLATAFLLSACGAADEENQAEGTREPVPLTAPPADPRMQETQGFWRASTLPEPLAAAEFSLPSEAAGGESASARLEVLSLDSDGEFARLVLAWLPPVAGPALGAQTLTAQSARAGGVPWVRLVDTRTAQVLEPLQGESGSFDHEAPPQVRDAAPADMTRGACICSYALGEDSSRSGKPERTELIFVDFPAPEGGRVDVFAGEWHEPLSDVPISTDEPFMLPDDGLAGFRMLSAAARQPSPVYGSGARYARTEPLRSRTDHPGGLIVTGHGRVREVHIPAGALFGQDSYELDADDDLLGGLAGILDAQAAGGTTAVVEGHTAQRNDQDRALDLSERRARALARELESRVDSDLPLEAEGHGVQAPLVPHADLGGAPVEEHRDLNERMTLRYVPADGDDAAELPHAGAPAPPELPEAEETETAEGAALSVLLPVPGEPGAAPGDEAGEDVGESADESGGERGHDDHDDDDESDDAEDGPRSLRLDVQDAEREGDIVTVRLAFALTGEDETDPEAFSGQDQRGGSFGPNLYAAPSPAVPGAANLALTAGGQQHRPLAIGAAGCLCTEVAGTGTALSTQPSPMFARFRLPERTEGPPVIRIAGTAQFTLPEELTERIMED
ncbi:OmpA family protein [Sediminivirga luteola]|uniref:OmpA family protein n=1 Tax=Sediminivirga luteola TaxID=1774748 RepID=UPI001F56775A|nr:OmpA family protein [Sediminivirga luteola]MCI2266046.1 hypothetical protein [Sediminivirga luteola]